MEERILEELINKQLEPYNKKYEDVKSDAAWTLKFETTKEDQQKFMDWSVEFLIKEMKLNLLHDGCLKEEMTKLTVTKRGHGKKNQYGFCSGSQDGEDSENVVPENYFELIGRNLEN